MHRITLEEYYYRKLQRKASKLLMDPTHLIRIWIESIEVEEFPKVVMKLPEMTSNTATNPGIVTKVRKKRNFTKDF